MGGPLEGIRVVELGVWVAGPSATGIMCDWGAEVVKVEPLTGDPLRGIGLMLAPGDLPPQFELDNRGKKSVALDLATPEGHEAMLVLVRRADVFVSNVRYGGLERLGLGYEALRAENPRLVYAHVSAYGPGHEDSDRAAFDVGAYWARGGVAWMLQGPGGELPVQRGGMGDHFTGSNAAGAICAALFHRERTGEGQLITTSLARTAAYQLGWDLNQALKGQIMPAPVPRERSPNPLIAPYPVKGGRWIWLLMLQGDRHWPDFLRAIDREEWAADPRFETLLKRFENGPALVAAIDEVMAQRTQEEWAPILDAHDIWWAPVHTIEEVTADPLMAKAGAWVDVPTADGGTRRMVATPADFHGTPWAPAGPVPQLGQDTEIVLMDLGYEWEQIEALKAKGVIP
jgi:crotonobetainyl-CoA:carnitine CoA-transferase CaiB-like acyl-CoA transferase